MNPIKTPREMLFEMLGVPSMAGGGVLASSVQKAIAAFKRMYGKEPSPDDIKALEAYAESMGQPTSGLRTGQSAVPRAQYELATDPNIINPDIARDEFLLQSLTGRTQKGTRLAPKVYDVTDPVNIQRMEANQMAGAYDDITEGRQFGSVTPSADYFATQAAARENTALGAGKIPLIDQLKLQFFKQNKRYPNDEELEMVIAEYNPMRHRYGSRGASIVGERPATARGMQDWRGQARTEGIPEAYLNKPPADYPQYLKDELDILKGRLPGVAAKQTRARKGSAPTPGSTITRYDEMGNPVEVQNFAAGSRAISPEQMRFDMAASGLAPSKFADPYQKALAEAMSRDKSRVSPSALARMKQGAGRVGSAGLRGLNVAAVPLSAYDTGDRLARGDYPGAALSGVTTLANAAALYPPLTVPASIVGLGAEGANMLRDYLMAPKSVMEEMK